MNQRLKILAQMNKTLTESSPAIIAGKNFPLSGSFFRRICDKSGSISVQGMEKRADSGHTDGFTQFSAPSTHLGHRRVHLAQQMVS
jgi:hypothetical protein